MPEAKIRHYRDMGAVLRAVRQQKGLRQEDLADNLGISRGYLVELENGRSTQQLTRLFRALNALGIRVTLSWENDADDSE